MQVLLDEAGRSKTSKTSIHDDRRSERRVSASNAKYRDLRIENTLPDENGDDVRLKKGARVAITVSTKTSARDP